MEENKAMEQAMDMIEAGKDVLVEMKDDGTFDVAEWTTETAEKAGMLETVGPVAIVFAGGFVAGLVAPKIFKTIGKGVTGLVNSIKAKKEAKDREKAFDKMYREAFGAEAKAAENKTDEELKNETEEAETEKSE